jgi:hypothetical protein
MLKNKRSEWGFEDFGDVPILNMSKEVMSYYEEWLLDTSRQDNSDTHKDTFAIQMRALDYLHGLNTPGECITKRRLLSELAILDFNSIVARVEELGQGKLIRAEFVNMKPRSRVRTHKDRSDILYVSRRFHVPIKTNKLVTFYSENIGRHLEAGRLYELNNIKYHSVRNDSDENRIHLILDVLPEQYLEGIRFIDETE